MRVRSVGRLALSLVAVATLASCSASDAVSPPEPECAPGASCVTNTAGLPPGFVRLADIDPTILQEIRYHQDHNFVGRQIDGYDAGQCWLTRPAAEALRQVQANIRSRGFTLKVYDCYRPQRAVTEFMSWSFDPFSTQMKEEFYPRVTKSDLVPDGYIAEKSGHSRGSTVDLTLVARPGNVSPTWDENFGLQDCVLPAPQRFPDTSVDMGTGYDCFDVLSHTANPKITGLQRENRQILLGMMVEGGFRNLAEEWWHYTLNNEPYPETYFDVPITG